MTNLKHWLALLRIPHWTKSVFVLLGVIYSWQFAYLGKALLAALAFCLLSSAVYVYNDIQDKEEDSLHPHKCKRPLACDLVPLDQAVILLFLLLLTAMSIGWMVSHRLALILACYLFINLAYNHGLRLFPFWDVLCISLGFVLRVLAGSVGIGLEISPWLMVMVSLLSLFIALGKRRLELNLDVGRITRQVLKKYDPEILKNLMILTGALCFVNYMFYTLFTRDQQFYLMLTLPFAAFVLWRFLKLTSETVGNDDPVNVILRDRWSIINLICFFGLTLFALAQ